MDVHFHYALHRRERPRLGISVLEVIAALLILSFAIAGLTQMLSLSAAQRRTSEARRLALEEVGNQAERLALLPWDETTAERLQTRGIGGELRTHVPSAKISFALTEEAGPPLGRRIDIAVAWTDSAGEVEPVRLTVWKLQPAETIHE